MDNNSHSLQDVKVELSAYILLFQLPAPSRKPITMLETTGMDKLGCGSCQKNKLNIRLETVSGRSSSMVESQNVAASVSGRRVSARQTGAGREYQ